MRRVLVVAALAASVAAVTVAVVALARPATTRPAPTRADVYTQLAQQLKSHLHPLVPGPLATKVGRPLNKVPNIQVPRQNGYSCSVATTNGCSLHPCVKYAEAQAAVPYYNGAPVVSATTTSGCQRTANAAPHAIPINAP